VCSRCHSPVPLAAVARHTKHQVLGGEEVLQLPPKTEEEVAVVMGPEERQLYMKVHQEAKVGGWGCLRQAAGARLWGTAGCAVLLACQGLCKDWLRLHLLRLCARCRRAIACGGRQALPGLLSGAGVSTVEHSRLHHHSLGTACKLYPYAF
jgi:hypothetical protein